MNTLPDLRKQLYALDAAILTHPYGSEERKAATIARNALLVKIRKLKEQREVDQTDLF